ncbi:MAG: hypothetical protein ABWU84_03125 [Pyrobaculum sp.]|uniref:hypothetical protein n=1 Tax=Pyrobaculum sp. TaxID=2004705 RepID=UPI003EEF0769
MLSFTARDLLGVPNPTAWAYLCGRLFDADAFSSVYAAVEMEKLCYVTVVRQWPISPLTLAIIITASVAVL